MKSAFDDLKIADVMRKPASVPADLRVGNLDERTIASLWDKGFFVAIDPQKSGSHAIYSKFGDISLQMSDGARYVLRFGNTTGASSTGNTKDKKADAKEGMDRYLFVMVDFNEDAIPKPALEQLPPEEKPAAKTDEKKADEKKPEEKKTDDKKSDDKKADAKKPDDGKKDEPKKPADAKADDAKKADSPKADAKKDDVKKDEPKKEELSKADAAALADKAKARKAEQERIDKENQRRQDEYKEKVAAGKKHVDELNKRFAQWYYVIPGDVYEKIHLDRKSIVKKKEPPKDEHGHDHDHGADHGPDLPTGPAGAIDKVPEPGK
jgi:hypothetical protein